MLLPQHCACPPACAAATALGLPSSMCCCYITVCALQHVLVLQHCVCPPLWLMLRLMGAFSNVRRRYCLNVSDTGLERLATHCKRLGALNLKHISNITETGRCSAWSRLHSWQPPALTRVFHSWLVAARCFHVDCARGCCTHCTSRWRWCAHTTFRRWSKVGASCKVVQLQCPQNDSAVQHGHVNRPRATHAQTHTTTMCNCAVWRECMERRVDVRR
jgi:hypothetical protein